MNQNFELIKKNESDSCTKKTIIIKTKLLALSWSGLSLTFMNRLRWWVILVFGHLDDRWGCGDGFLCWRLWRIALTDVQVSTALWGWVNASENLSHGNTRERHVWTQISIGPSTEGQIYNGHTGLQLQTQRSCFSQRATHIRTNGLGFPKRGAQVDEKLIIKPSVKLK